MPRAATLKAPARPQVEETPLEIAAIYRAHAHTVARWAARLSPGLDTEDVVQEVFLIAHRLLPSFRGEARVTTWLFRITHNVVRHRRRKERVRRFLLGMLAQAPDRAEVAAPGPSPVEDLLRVEAQAQVYQVLDGMREKYRTVFILFEIEGLSGDEIAALLGQKVATIWVWLHRARAQFVKGLSRIEREERA